MQRGGMSAAAHRLHTISDMLLNMAIHGRRDSQSVADLLHAAVAWRPHRALVCVVICDVAQGRPVVQPRCYNAQHLG
jgi:hypothetical protein